MTLPGRATLSASASAVVLAALAGAGSAKAGWPVLVLCLLLPVVWRYPLPVLLFAAFLFEEINPNSSFARKSPYLVGVGHEFYTERIGPLSPALWLVLLAAAVSLCRFHPRLSPIFWNALIVCSMYAFLFVAACLYWEVGAGQIIRLLAPQAALLGALIVGYFGLSDEPQRRVALYCIAVALFAKLGFAALILAQSPTTSDGSLQISFYDTALPTAAAAVLFGAALRDTGRWRLLFMAAAAIVVILSLRRSLWLACILFCLLVIFLNPRARKRLRKPLVALACAGVLSFLVIPSYVGQILGRFVTGLTAAFGDSQEQSATGHIVDLEIGFDAARNHPWTGVGPYGQPIPGLVVQEALYVHNELLQAWLRFGMPGLVAVVLFSGWSVVLAVRILRGRFGSAPTAGAVMLILTPVNAVTAPFLTTTARWPIFCGIALSYVLHAASGRSDDGVLAWTGQAQFASAVATRGRAEVRGDPSPKATNAYAVPYP